MWLLVLACAHTTPAPESIETVEPVEVVEPPPRAVSCCECQMWGVTGIQQRPEWRPPPMPEACTALLAEPSCAEKICPVPP